MEEHRELRVRVSHARGRSYRVWTLRTVGVSEDVLTGRKVESRIIPEAKSKVQP